MTSTATERTTTTADTLNACTIVARNYLPRARVFVQSLTAVHPSARVTVLVIDGDSDPADSARFRTLHLADVACWSRCGGSRRTSPRAATDTPARNR